MYPDLKRSRSAASVCRGPQFTAGAGGIARDAPALDHHTRLSSTTCTCRYSGVPLGTSTTPPLHRTRLLMPSSPSDASMAPERASTSPAHTRPHNRFLKRLPASVVQDSTSPAPPHRPPRHLVPIRSAPSADLQFATALTTSSPQAEGPPERPVRPTSPAPQPDRRSTGPRPSSGPHHHARSPPPRHHADRTAEARCFVWSIGRRLRAASHVRHQLRMFECDSNGHSASRQSGNSPISRLRLPLDLHPEHRNTPTDWPCTPMRRRRCMRHRHILHKPAPTGPATPLHAPRYIGVTTALAPPHRRLSPRLPRCE
jgi:hypothetical protein